jgi:hypothetical protein
VPVDSTTVPVDSTTVPVDSTTVSVNYTALSVLLAVFLQFISIQFTNHSYLITTHCG